MNWLILVAITIFLDAIRIFIDNYTSDVFFKGHSAVSQKLFYGYVWVFLSILILIVTGFNPLGADYSFVWLIVFSGILSSLAGIPYYKALEIDDSTNLGIFFQLAPIMYLVFGWLFFGETISILQLLAFLVILAAPILIIKTARKKSRKIKLQAVFYTFIYVLIAAIANLMFVKIGPEDYNFVHKIALMFLGQGIASLFIVYLKPAWRQRFKVVFKKHKKKLLPPLIANTICGIIKSTTYRAALTLAPTITLASAASDAAEPMVIFFMGIILTLIWPKFGREKLNKKSVLVHLGATVLVVIGVILLQF